MLSQLKLIGYDLIGNQGNEGIRIAWQYDKSNHIVESASFQTHRKDVNDGVCGYTTSVSAGCVLRAMGCPCMFCRTGQVLPFTSFLSATDIAKENILMVLSDIYCSDYPHLKKSLREFAYMGQGEPGFSYTQVRLAIEITNKVMKKLNQTVYRHIIATVGVPEMIYAIKQDILSHFYSERVTLHFSLHATKSRDKIMPINKKINYNEVLSAMNDFVHITGEKPCIGIMLFKNYENGNDILYSNDIETIKHILNEIPPDKFRLSFCEFNGAYEIGNSQQFTCIESKEILNLSKELGFEAKLFSSFGKSELSACGLLGGQKPQNLLSDKLRGLEQQAETLINEAMQEITSQNL